MDKDTRGFVAFMAFVLMGVLMIVFFVVGVNSYQMRCAESSGVEAGKYGLPPESNPHLQGAARAWLDGWNKGKRMAEEVAK